MGKKRKEKDSSMKRNREIEKDSSMAKIFDSVTMAQLVRPANAPPGEGLAAHTIEEVRAVVGEFLKKQPDVRRVNVTKLVQIDPEQGSWEAEADVYVPNTTIRNLGLPVQREVLDCRQYLLRIDGQLNIIAYGLRDLVEERT